MNTTPTPPARLRLRAHDPTPARVEIVRRSSRTRLARALLALLGFWALAPIAFLVPPHLPWAVAAALAGIFFGYKQWAGEYIVRSFTGRCPRCGNELAIPENARVRLPHPMHCYQCHHEPVLEVDASAIPRTDG